MCRLFFFFKCPCNHFDFQIIFTPILNSSSSSRNHVPRKLISDQNEDFLTLRQSCWDLVIPKAIIQTLFGLNSWFVFFPTEAWKSSRTGQWKMRRKWNCRRSNWKRPNTLLRRLTANTRRQVSQLFIAPLSIYMLCNSCHHLLFCHHILSRCIKGFSSWCFNVMDSVLWLQVARKLVIIESDLERTEERAELSERWKLPSFLP